MPWKVEKSDQYPASKPWAVIKEADGAVEGCHESQEKAQAQQAALYAGEERGIMSKLRDLRDKFVASFDRAIEEQERAWDGSASNYSSTEAYCAACLIDVNSAAGRDTKAQSHCMLPARAEGSSSYDFEGIQAAAGGHGISQVQRPSDVPEDAWNSAVKSAANTIISQYGKNDEVAPDSVYEAAGKTPPERAVSLSQMAEQFYNLLGEQERWEAWPLDVYLDGDSTYMLVAERGKLYRVGLALEGSELRTGEWQEVETVHQPVGRTRITRQADGRYRWLNISATAALNRVAEIDSRALFDDFIRRAEETGGYPLRDFFHLGEAAIIGRCDLLARDDAVFITSGVYNDTPLARAIVAATLAEPGQWGDSISYLPEAEPELVEVAEGVRVPVYNEGTLRYIATLPENRAASLFTTTRVQEVTRMRQEIKDLLLRLTEYGLPEDEIDKIEQAVDGTNREIADGGLVNREETGGETEPEPKPEGDGPETETEPEPEPEERQVILDDEALGAIVERVMAGEVVTGLLARVQELEGGIAGLRSDLDEAHALAIKRGAETDKRLGKLERDDEDKRREWQADLPARARTVVTYRPREAKAAAEGDKPDLAAKAEATLAAWPKA
jgi:hypothetical protein